MRRHSSRKLVGRDRVLNRILHGIEPPVPPSGPACDTEIPHEIHLLVPNTLDDVLFKYKDAKWNPPLIEGAFTQPVPGGVEQITTTCSDDE